MVERKKEECEGGRQVLWLDYLLASLEDVRVVKHNT